MLDGQNEPIGSTALGALVVGMVIGAVACAVFYPSWAKRLPPESQCHQAAERCETAALAAKACK